MCNILESVKSLKIIFLNYNKRIGNELDIYKLLYSYTTYKKLFFTLLSVLTYK